MNRTVLFLLALAIGSQCPSAREPRVAREWTKEELQARQLHFHNMKKTGYTLAIIGGFMVVGGIMLAANGEWETTETTTGTQANAQNGAAVGGTLLIVGGIPTTVLGLIFGGIGSRREVRYQQLIDAMAVHFEYGEARKGLRLSYGF